MADPYSEFLIADVAGMTNVELSERWRSASDEETENLSPLLEAIVNEMGKRGIAF